MENYIGTLWLNIIDFNGRAKMGIKFFGGNPIDSWQTRMRETVEKGIVAHIPPDGGQSIGFPQAETDSLRHRRRTNRHSPLVGGCHHSRDDTPLYRKWEYEGFVVAREDFSDDDERNQFQI